MTASRFDSVEDVAKRLANAGYLTDESIATVVFLAEKLGKPLLVEGPAGTGKTELAKSVATALEAKLIRLQCYEGVDEAKSLYEWNYKKQLLRIQAEHDREMTWEEVETNIFGEDFLLERPLLAAIRNEGSTTLLIDEIDKVDFEFEGLLLEILSDFQVSIPEMGTVVARQIPFVVLTSNNSRELSEALKRRCLYLYLDYPDVEREKEIVLARVPEVPEMLADQLVRVVRSIRQMELKKAPSIAETLDWARTLLHLGITTLDEEAARRTLTVLLKFQTDVEKVSSHLKIQPRPSDN
ncbi:MAG: AAA family ATPase [Actinomycetota bacterium]|nr:MoxR family ATPase [Actinomycetota bacterium]